MKNWAIFILISITVFVILSDCAVTETPRSKNPQKKHDLSSQKPTSGGKNQKNRKGHKITQPLLESQLPVSEGRSSSAQPTIKAKKSGAKRRTKGGKRTKSLRFPTTTFSPTTHQPRQTAAGLGPLTADMPKNRGLRTDQAPMPGAPCCPGCFDRAVRISQEVFGIISRYDYPSMTQLDKVDIQPVLELSGPRRKRAPAGRECSRMLIVKHKFYQADIYLYGCTDQEQACSALCKSRMECRSADFVPEAKLCLLSTSTDSIGAASFAADLSFNANYLEKTQCSRNEQKRLKKSILADRQTSSKKRKKSHLRGSTTTKRPIMKRAADQWSGLPGVAFFGFKHDKRRIYPSSGSLAVSSVPHAHPWLVHLALKHGKRCAGVIVPWMTATRNSSSFVLTAAHCLKDYEPGNPESLVLSMGVVDYRYQSRSQINRVARDIFRHPNYDESPHWLEYDVALIKMDLPVQFSSTIAPIALPVSENQVPNRYNCVAAGWHMMRKKGYTMSSTLVHHVQMVIESSRMCGNLWGDQFNAASMICSNTMTRKEASCYGDSGGPLACRDGQTWTLFGVVSMGETRSQCVNSTKPLLYSRVTSIISWVRRIQKEHGDAMGLGPLAANRSVL